jgi:DNA-binding NarL/FixJ family response regulator
VSVHLLASESGRVGYLLKDRVLHLDDFFEALRRVGNGGTVVDPTVVARLLKNQADRSPRSALSARETEVLALMAEGRSNRAISDRLFVGEKTVESHVASISPSLGCCQPLMTTGGFLPSSLTSGSQARPDWSPRRLRPLAPAGDGSRPAR